MWFTEEREAERVVRLLFAFVASKSARRKSKGHPKSTISSEHLRITNKKKKFIDALLQWTRCVPEV